MTQEGGAGGGPHMVHVLLLHGLTIDSHMTSFWVIPRRKKLSGTQLYSMDNTKNLLVPNCTRKTKGKFQKGGRSWAKTASKRKEEEKGRVFTPRPLLVLLSSNHHPQRNTTCEELSFEFIFPNLTYCIDRIVGESCVGLLRH